MRHVIVVDFYFNFVVDEFNLLIDLLIDLNWAYLIKAYCVIMHYIFHIFNFHFFKMFIFYIATGVL